MRYSQIVVLAAFVVPVFIPSVRADASADEVRAFHEFTERMLNSGSTDPESVKKHYDSTLGPVQRQREEDAAKTGKIDPKPMSGSGSKGSAGNSTSPTIPSDQPTQTFIFVRQPSPQPAPVTEGSLKPMVVKSAVPAPAVNTGLGSLQSADVGPGWSFSKPKAQPSPQVPISKP